MSRIFSPLKLRDLTFRNRFFVSPMCQYSSIDGIPTDWHLVHLGSRAVGGAGLVMVEATALSPEGRISPNDSGIWTDRQAEAFKRIMQFIRGQGATAGIQLAHAGRKASTDLPCLGGGPLEADKGGWIPIAPSDIPFSAVHSIPNAATAEDLEFIRRQFGEGAEGRSKPVSKITPQYLRESDMKHRFAFMFYR